MISAPDHPRADAPAIAHLAPGDLRNALVAGWSDFRRAPLFGIAFGAVYVVFGLMLIGAAAVAFQPLHAVPLILGFPLVAPFAAVGLYETSRRLERKQALRWGPVLGVIWAERGRQLPWFGALMVVWFLFYLFVSHALFALTLGLGAIFDLGGSLGQFLTLRGLLALGLQLAIGGVFALTVFSACVISLPMMLDREVDFVTALVTSVRAVAINPAVMLAWAVTVVALLAVALLPALLGLFVVLPVLGHATWHLYRRVLPG